MIQRAIWLHALGAFEAAARHQNFARAAEELHLTASAVSHHVRKLEGWLGQALFQRHARGVQLTAEGRQLADAAGSALTDLDGVLQVLRAPQQERRRVRLTTLHSLAYTWLIPRLPRFRARHPDIRLRLDTEAALARFDDQGPDLGIRHGLGHWPGLGTRHLMDDWLFPVAAPGLPGIEGLRGAADLAALPLVADLARQGWADWFRAAGVHGSAPRELLTCNDTTDALAAAEHGLGAALARLHIAAPYLARGALVRLPGPALKARFSYWLVWPAHRPPGPAAQAFAEWVAEEARIEVPQLPSAWGGTLPNAG